LGQPVPCAELEINSRVCSCPDFLTGSDKLIGDAKFKGCAILINVASPSTLGYTLSNGYWNDWNEVLIADLDQSGYMDFWYSTQASQDVGWLANKQQRDVDSTPIWGRKPLKSTPLKQQCHAPTAYPDYPRSRSTRAMAVVCWNGTDLVAYTWNREIENFDPTPTLVLEDFNARIAKKRMISQTDPTLQLEQTTSADFNKDSQLDFLTLHNDDLYVLITEHTNVETTGYLKLMTFDPPLERPLILTRPLFYDFDMDGDIDFLFAATDTAHLAFYWYENTYDSSSGSDAALGTFVLKGFLRTAPSVPHTILVAELDANTTGLDLILTASLCYEMYLIPQFYYMTDIDLSNNTKLKIFNGLCDGCGCGSSGGIKIADIDYDGDLDLTNFLTGGVEILLNNYPTGGFVAQKVLGGAENGFLFDMDGDDDLDIVAIADGITVWYALSDPDECLIGIDNCEKDYPFTNCTNNAWQGYNCTCPESTGALNATKTPNGTLISCDDFNECLSPYIKNGGCDQNCVNTPGSFHCACNPGYVLVDGYKCENINECNNITLCDRKNGGCNDKIPGYECYCNPGWNLTSDGTPCIDIDECASPLLNECEQICKNSPGAYSCDCDEGYKLTFNEIVELNSDCQLLPCFWNTWNPWATCICGAETTRIRVQNNAASDGSKLCFDNQTKEEAFCSITKYCKSDSGDPQDVEEAMALLQKAYTDNYFRWMFPQLLPVTVNFTAETGLFIISTPNTDSLYLKNVTTVIHTEASYILGIEEPSLVYNIYYPNSTGKRDATVTIVFDVNGAYPPNYLIVIVAVCVAVPAALGFLVAWYWFYYRMKLKALTRDLSHLPKACTIHYKQAVHSPADWERVQEDPPVLRKVLTNKEDKRLVLDIFETLDGTGIGVKEIYAVYNQMLVSAFGLTREKFTQRAAQSAEVFLKEKWRENDESDRRRAKREWTMAFLKKKISYFPWNSFKAVPVLATIHGTAASAAWKICTGGFAALSSLDSGYYGAGIYFTTSAKYAVPYFATKPEPAIIISWVLVGNAYPVIEHPRKTGTLAGTIIKPGYQAHYVCTDNKGMPYPKLTPDYKNVYDEIVINQESQVAPAYVLMLDPTSFPKLIVEFNRKTAVPRGEMSRDEETSDDEDNSRGVLEDSD